MVESGVPVLGLPGKIAELITHQKAIFYSECFHIGYTSVFKGLYFVEIFTSSNKSPYGQGYLSGSNRPKQKMGSDFYHEKIFVLDIYMSFQIHGSTNNQK